MTQKRFVNRIKTIFIIAFVSTPFILEAQPDCRSILGAHYKPIGNSDLLWSVEGTWAGGLMPDRQIANWSVYGGLDYSKNKFQAYFEGAYKDWYNSASNPDGEEPQSTMPTYNKPTRYNWGLRELFIKYGDDKFTIKPGVQGVKSVDYLMIDERMLGVSANSDLGAIKMTGYLGTVSQRIARFQDVCGNRHIYNILHRSQYNFVGDKPGMSNLGGVFLTYRPGDKKSKESSNEYNDESEDDQENFDEFESFETFETDEFSSDEFSENMEFDKPKIFEINEMGLFFYEEFGALFHEYKYYFGGFAQVDLPLGIKAKVELVDQYIVNDHAMAVMINVEKPVTWNNGSSSVIEGGYLHKFNIDEGAHFYPAFTNLFKGEVMRLDAIDLPLVYGTFKHFFPGSNKLTMQVNGVLQPNQNHSREVDLIAGIKLFHHLRVSAIGSYLNSELLDNSYWMAKLELRLAF